MARPKISRTFRALGARKSACVTRVTRSSADLAIGHLLFFLRWFALFFRGECLGEGEDGFSSGGVFDGGERADEFQALLRAEQFSGRVDRLAAFRGGEKFRLLLDEPDQIDVERLR